jgi:hypothetical protein
MAVTEEPMWEQYQRTFRSMQALILVVTLGVMAGTHRWTTAGAFFVTMQLGAIFGAKWGNQIKQRTRRPDELSARRG